MADLTPEQQQEFEFRLRLEQEQAAAQPEQQQQTKQPDQVNPGFGMFGGAVAGQLAGPAVNTAYQEATKNAAAQRLGVSPADLEWDSPGQRWARKTGFGAGEGHTVEEVDRAFKEMQAARNAPLGKGKIASRNFGPMNPEAAASLDAQEVARQARFAEQRAKEAAALKAGMPAEARLAEAIGISPGAQSVLSGLYKGAGRAIPAVLGRGLMGGLAGLQGFDAYNRFKQGDYLGAAIGGLGTLGSVASFVPTPMTRIGGSAIGMGAEALNSYLDSLRKQHHAAGGQIAMADGGLVYLR